MTGPWPGEPEAENRAMRERYRKEIDRLAGRIDRPGLCGIGWQAGRGDRSGDGLFHSACDCIGDHVPIHCWEDFTAAEAYEKSGKTGKAVFVHYWGKSE